MQVLKIKCYVFVVPICFSEMGSIYCKNLVRAHCLKKGRTKNENKIRCFDKDFKKSQLRLEAIV